MDSYNSKTTASPLPPRPGTDIFCPRCKALVAQVDLDGWLFLTRGSPRGSWLAMFRGGTVRLKCYLPRCQEEFDVTIL